MGRLTTVNRHGHFSGEAAHVEHILVEYGHDPNIMQVALHNRTQLDFDDLDSAVELAICLADIDPETDDSFAERRAEREQTEREKEAHEREGIRDLTAYEEWLKSPEGREAMAWKWVS